MPNTVMRELIEFIVKTIAIEIKKHEVHIDKSGGTGFKVYAEEKRSR